MTRRVISDAEAQFYHENGYLIVRDALDPAELVQMQQAMQALVDYGMSEVRAEPDYHYGTGHKTGGQVLRRIEFVIDKCEEAKVLLANPFILRSVEKLMGPDFFPTWDAMVIKAPGEGIIVPWHRDAAPDCVGDKPIFNVDFYLDAATEENGVWVIPGSHRWSAAEANAYIAANQSKHQTVEDFRASGAVPALMQPGDVLFHDILVLHASPATTVNALRRIVYYEFRTAHVEEQLGPHIPEYIPIKQRVLLSCLERRKQAAYVPAAEEPFAYGPPAPYNNVSLAPGEELPTYRYAHSEYWRK